MLTQSEIEELRMHARAIARLLGPTQGRRPYQREGRASKPLAAALDRPQGSGVTRTISEALVGVTEVTTRRLCELLDIPEREQGRATLTRLGQELRELGWNPQGPRVGPTRARVYRRPEE